MSTTPPNRPGEAWDNPMGTDGFEFIEYAAPDGKVGELLLQIFSENQLGPIFFEFIQRKGDQGFGEGNFKALFESMELDQMRRGVLEKV